MPLFGQAGSVHQLLKDKDMSVSTKRWYLLLASIAWLISPWASAGAPPYGVNLGRPELGSSLIFFATLALFAGIFAWKACQWGNASEQRKAHTDSPQKRFPPIPAGSRFVLAEQPSTSASTMPSEPPSDTPPARRRTARKLKRSKR
jgi:hypothetical protein